MPWVEIFEVFFVSHLLGDYLLQTEWQAVNKRGGLTGTPVQRRALFSHIATYTLAYVPSLIWLWDGLHGWVFADRGGNRHTAPDPGRRTVAGSLLDDRQEGGHHQEPLAQRGARPELSPDRAVRHRVARIDRRAGHEICIDAADGGRIDSRRASPLRRGDPWGNADSRSCHGEAQARATQRIAPTTRTRRRVR